MEFHDSNEKHHLPVRSSSCSSPPPSYTVTFQTPVVLPNGPSSHCGRTQSLHHQESIGSYQPYDARQGYYQHHDQWTAPIPYDPPQYERQHTKLSSVELPHNDPSYFSNMQLATQQPSLRPRPCVIPQVTKAFGGAHMSPFIRVRAPELEQQYDLSSTELLTFIDGLNESFLANPALRAVGAAGNIVSFVPLASTQIAGGAISLAAGLGAAGISFVRTKRFMKRANENIFKPKGLHVQLCKTNKMLGHIGMENNGAVVFAGQQGRTILENPQAEYSDDPISRRMDVLGTRVMPLSLHDVNPPLTQDNWMKKVGAYSAQRAESKQLEKLNKEQAKSEKKRDKHDRKVSKAQWKQDNIDGKVECLTEDLEDIRMRMRSLDLSSPRYEKAHKELQKQRKEMEKELRGAERDQCRDRASRKSHKLNEKVEKRQHKEAKKLNKILWIVIMPDADCDSDGDDDWDSDESSEKHREVSKVDSFETKSGGSGLDTRISF